MRKVQVKNFFLARSDSDFLSFSIAKRRRESHNEKQMAKYALWKHFHTVNHHRFLVFLYCTRCGLFWRGLFHDLSKYSPSEFFVSARNYSGTKSPIANERKEEHGYSKAFIHHTRKNKHHFEYWVDVTTGDIILAPMPFQYALESCFDMIAASKVYNGKKFNRSMPLCFFTLSSPRSLMHPATKEFIKTVISLYEKNGLEDIHKKKMKKLYSSILLKYPPTIFIPVYSRDHPNEKNPFFPNGTDAALEK